MKVVWSDLESGYKTDDEATRLEQDPRHYSLVQAIGYWLSAWPWAGSGFSWILNLPEAICSSTWAGFKIWLSLYSKIHLCTLNFPQPCSGKVKNSNTKLVKGFFFFVFCFFFFFQLKGDIPGKKSEGCLGLITKFVYVASATLRPSAWFQGGHMQLNCISIQSTYWLHWSSRPHHGCRFENLTDLSLRKRWSRWMPWAASDQ